ncbi:MAG: glycosyltransferase [Bacteroidia bacterium]|nr:glycosyltransferase [Bacteroidia bacterium]MDW8158091.1 glycosyltransferase [Bacteroidia bacterium]
MTKQQKVILVVTNDLVTDQRIHKMALTLMQLGWQVELVGRIRKNSLPLSSRPYATYRLKLFFEKGKLFYFEFTIRLFLFLLFHKTQIITANDLDTLLPCCLIAWIKKNKLIYDTHEYFTEVPELINKPLEKKIWLFIEKILFYRLKRIITVNERIACEYQKKYHKPIIIIKNLPFYLPLAIDENIIKQKIDQKILLYQGSVNIGRGIELMLETLNLLQGFTLWIVGSGDILEKMKQLAAELKVEKQVVFWGTVPFENLPSLTPKAFIGFSLEEDLGLNYRYATPNKIYDYIQARTPVIVSNLPEMKKVVFTYRIGCVLEKRTPQSLASLILYLFQNRSLYSQLIEQTQKVAQELCWEKQVELVKKVYTQ